MKLGDWIPVWLECYKLGTIKQTSYHQLENLVKHIPTELKDCEMDEIRPMDLQAFVNRFGLTASKSYMDKMRVILHSLYTTAIDNKICISNPTRTIHFPNVPEQPRESYMTNDVRTIIDFAMGYHNRAIGIAIVTLLLTGLRRGELLGLKWTDLSETMLTVKRGVYMENNRPCVQEYLAKTADSIRTIPLLPELAYLLHTLPKTSEFIFCTRNGTMISPRNFSRSYTTFFRHLQEQNHNISYLPPHCCRHTFASLCLDSGTDVRTVQQLLGHGDIRSTARYVHPHMATLQRAVSSLHESIFTSECPSA